jgi:hypothetical protein
MQRRKFIQSIGIAAAGAALMPLALQNNDNNKHYKKHVVLCILGGGIKKNSVLGASSLMPKLSSYANQYTYANVGYEGNHIGHYDATFAILAGNLDTWQANKNIFEWHKNANTNTKNYQAYFVANQRADYSTILAGLNKNYQPQIIKPIALPHHLPYTNDQAVFEKSIEIIQTTTPHLLVLNLQDADIAHSNTNDYNQVLKHADNQIEMLWNTIQNNENMRNQTTLIIMPEHGRNNYDNEIFDGNGLAGTDHHHQSAREIFTIVRSNQTAFNNPTIETKFASHHILSKILMA